MRWSFLVEAALRFLHAIPTGELLSTPPVDWAVHAIRDSVLSATDMRTPSSSEGEPVVSVASLVRLWSALHSNRTQGGGRGLSVFGASLGLDHVPGVACLLEAVGMDGRCHLWGADPQ